MYGLGCSFCKLTFHNVAVFFVHLETEKHRENVRAAGLCVPSLRLQDIVGTHLREDPLLGLEYIEEEGDPPFYVYSCLLCNVRASLLEALQHVLSQSHVVRYIRKHHDHLWPKHPHKESLDEGTLRYIALAIQKKYGCQNIPPKTSDTATTGTFPWLYCVTKTCSCSFCDASFSIGTLEAHLKSRNHNKYVKQAAPELLKEQEKLQYLLDTYFREEPILGLEYIVEEFTSSSASYKYTCLLCHVEYNGCKMVIHLLSCEHMTQYIDAYQSELSLSGKDYKSKENFQRDLQQRAVLICKNDGKKTIQVRTSKVTDLDLTGLLPEENDSNQNGDLASKDQVVEYKTSCLKGKALQPSPQLNDTTVLHKVKNNSKHVSRKLFKKCYCSLCGVNNFSVPIHCSHIMGKKHRAKLNRATSEQVKEKDRLQYILDTYMKKEVILGLEYLVEREKDSSSYSYTCLLCNVEACLTNALFHILSKKHTSRYIMKEHKDLRKNCPASVIQKRYGRKRILFKKAYLEFGTKSECYEKCFCKLCALHFDTKNLAAHVMERRHRTNLDRIAPGQLEKLDRLQYFLDTHVGEEPLLGLEYIVEEFLFSCPAYKYTCQLCNVDGEWHAIVLHIISEAHMMQYIDKHHSDLSLLKKNYTVKTDFLKDLRQCALTICKNDGNKKIRIKSFDATDLHLSRLLPEDNEGKNGVVTSEDQVAEDKNSCFKNGVLQPSLLGEMGVSDTAVLRDVESQTVDDSSYCFKKPKFQQCTCDLCGVSTSSVASLCLHIMGWGHKRNLKRATSQQVKEKDRLQYILDTYMKEDVILGLEYLVEQEKDSSSYSYTCLLCNVEACLSDALTHILDKKHTFRYIEKEHKNLLPNSCSSMSLHYTFLLDIASKIQKSYGRRQIRKAFLEFGTEAEDYQNCFCKLCVLSFDTTNLAVHVMGEKHRTILQRIAPGQLKKLERLQDFLDTHLQDEPLLGLEYIEEEFVFSFPSYKYTCQLCSVEDEWHRMVLHIISEEHMMQYIDKHHSDLALLKDNYIVKTDLRKDLRQRALTICKKDGKKKICFRNFKATDLQLTRLLPEEDDGKQSSNISSEDQVAKVEMSSMKDGALQSSPQGEKILSDTVALQDVESKTVDESSHCFKTTEIQKCICSLCEVSTSSVVALCLHIMRWGHKRNLQRATSQQEKEKDRLQYILDTYMKEEVILGLEYLVEQEEDSSSYSYTCLLCNVEACLADALTHILDMKHTFSYIKSEHKDLLPKNSFDMSLHSKLLLHTASMIQKRYGRKQIQFRKTHLEFRRNDEFNQTCFCKLCSLSFDTKKLAAHTMGDWHRSNLEKIAPGQLKKLDRLQYFLDTHLWEEPLLGLEYIVEKFVFSSPSYKYTCQLCNVDGEWHTMVLHIISEEHMMQYIKKHYRDLFILKKNYIFKNDFLKDLRQCTLTICKTDGKKKIHFKTSDVADCDLTRLLPVEDDEKQNSDLTYGDQVAEDEKSRLKDGTLQPSPQDEKALSDTAVVRKVESKTVDNSSYCFIKPEINKCICSLCGVSTSSVVALCLHIMGWGHKGNLQRATSQQVKEKDRLQYILDTYMKEEVILGLEYLVEQEKDSSSYSYTCLLCNGEFCLSDALKHILNKKHLFCYIEREHKYLLPKNCSSMSLHENFLLHTASMIQQSYGHKQIRFRKTSKNPSKRFPAQFLEIGTGNGFFCKLCDVNFDPNNLAIHVVKERHRRRLERNTPGQLKKLDRLQYFLDTHLWEEPLLGLEYIVEESLSSSPSYNYTCRLCNMQGEWDIMLLHIISQDHMVKYIGKHHSGLLKKVYNTENDLLKDLKKNALAICKNVGKKKIHIKTYDVNRLLPEEDSGKQYGGLTSENQASCLKDKALQPSPEEEKALSDTAALQDVESKTVDSSLFCLKPKIQQCICSLCEMSTSSVVALCLHIMGWVHKENLQLATSQQVKEKDRLQNILDTYMKKEVILGLEYLVEQEKDSSSYSYTCLLCNVEACLSDALTHILGKRHAVRYMEREHKDLLPDNFSTMSLYNKVFTETALVIQERYGRKEIQVKRDEETTKEALLPQITDVDVLESRRSDTCSCSLCDATFSVTDLNKHVMGEGHRINWERTSPEQVEEVGRLKYLLDVYLKDCPLLGLEYILEMQMDSGYRYICTLCNLETDCYQTIDHMTGEDHLTRYIDRHHCKLSLQPDMYPQKEDYKHALSVIVFHIYTKYGRKDIQMKLSVDSGKGKRTSSTLGEKTPDPKKRRLEECSEQGIEHDETSPIQELELRRNDHFFNYLRDFAIVDQEDALFVQKIIQNCTDSLFKFEQQQGGCAE